MIFKQIDVMRDLYLVGPVEHAGIELSGEVHSEHSLCKLLVQHRVKQQVILHEWKPAKFKLMVYNNIQNVHVCMKVQVKSYFHYYLSIC